MACVASVYVWFRSKKRPWKGIFGFDRARNETRTKKRRRGEEGGSFLSSPRPLRSFTCSIFLAFFDSCSSFFAPKPRRNACYAGYSLDQTFNGIYRDSTNFPLTRTVFRFLSEFEKPGFYSNFERNLTIAASLTETGSGPFKMT